jgi:hypothetical protein
MRLSLSCEQFRRLKSTNRGEHLTLTDLSVARRCRLLSGVTLTLGIMRIPDKACTERVDPESEMQKNTRQTNTRRKRIDRINHDETLEKQRLDLELDRQLEATFPASDALKVTLRHSDNATKSKRLVRTKR